MFNVVINNEQYDEYLSQKEKIKELETLVDAYRLKAIAANGMYHNEHIKNVEYEAQKEKIKELEALLDSTYKNYQSALSDKAALIEKRDEYKELYMKQIIECNELRFENDKRLNELKSIKEADEAIIKERNELLIENDELKNKVIRFKELVIENYRLKQSINDLKANNKELKANIKEPIGTITINPCRDLEDVYLPDNNSIINIKNLCFTNNYFSEEDKNNGGK